MEWNEKASYSMSLVVGNSYAEFYADYKHLDIKIRRKALKSTTNVDLICL